MPHPVFNKNLLRKAMKDLGLTQMQLRDLTRKIDPNGKGVSQAFISKLLIGRKTMALPQTIDLLATALEFNPATLYIMPTDQSLASAFSEMLLPDLERHFTIASNPDDIPTGLIARTKRGEQLLDQMVSAARMPSPTDAVE